MDRHPWIYALMAQEMIREGKLEEPADAESVRVSDLRNYAYVEACAWQDGTELSFEVLLRGGERWYSSHHGDPKARVGRSGCFRSSVELPGGTDASRIGALRIACFEAPPPKGQKRVPKPQARLDRIGPVFLLEENYQPGPPVKLERRASASLEPGDSLVLSAP